MLFVVLGFISALARVFAALSFIALGLVLFGLPQANAFTINEFTLPLTTTGPAGITAGPDGNLWFNEFIGKIGRITPAGVVTEFPNYSSSFMWPGGITAGPDGNIWFTEFNGEGPAGTGSIGRITPSGSISKFTVPIGQPQGIITGSDGNLWFTNLVWVGRITPAGLLLPEFLVNMAVGPGITLGPDDNIWFTDQSFYNYIGRMTASGDVTKFTFNYGSCYCYEYLEQIVVGPDGNLWFTKWHGNKIGRITPAGVITEFPVPTANSEPIGITAGPDGNIWFTEYLGGKIGQVWIRGRFSRTLFISAD